MHRFLCFRNDSYHGREICNQNDSYHINHMHASVSRDKMGDFRKNFLNYIKIYYMNRKLIGDKLM